MQIKVLNNFGRIFAGIALCAVSLSSPDAICSAPPSTVTKKRPAPIGILQSARDHFNQGEYDQARRLYLQVLSSFPRNFELVQNLAYCYYSLGPAGRAGAAHYYGLAHRLNPASQAVTEKLARCYSDLKRHKDAAALLRDLAESPGAKPDRWKELGRECQAGGQTSDAVAAYGEYLRRKPDDLDASTSLGIIEGERTDYAKALDDFQSVLSRKPDFAPALVGKARVYSWQKRYAESLDLFDRVLSRDSEDSDAASGKAFTLLWMGRAREAEALFARLHQRFPRDGELARGLSEARSALHPKAAGPEPPHDEAYFRQRLAQNPLDAAALKALAVISSSPQRCRESVDFGRKAIKLSPEDASLEIALANSLSYCQQYNEAILHYRHYLLANPDSQGAHYELSQALLRSHQTEESIAVLENVLKLDPANLDARLSLAQAHAALGQYGDASDLYDQALKAQPENYDALQGKAFILYWTKHFPEARAIFQSLQKQQPADPQNGEALGGIRRAEERAKWASIRPAPGSAPAEFAHFYRQRLTSDPDDLDAWRGLAQAEVQLKDYAAAAHDYQKLAEENPGDLDVQMEGARLLAITGDTTHAIGIYESIVNAAPSNDDAQLRLAKLYAQTNQSPEAAATYLRLSARHPGNLDFKMELARLEISLHQFPAAREVLSSVIFADPHNHEARISLAELELQEGAWDASLKHFGEVLKEDAEDPDALMGKARIAYYRGNLEEARRSAQRVVQVQPNNFDAVFLLANIEHARGDHRAAFGLLSQAARLSPGNQGVIQMRERVSEEASMTITSTATFSREIGPPSSCSDPHGCGQLDLHEDLRSSSLGTTIEASLLHRTRSYFSFTALPSSSPLGRDAAGNPIPTGISGAVALQQFLYRQSTPLTSQLTLRLGAGWVKFGPGVSVELPSQPQRINSATSSAVAQGGFSYAASKRVQFHLDLDHSAVPYSPVAVRLGVLESRAQGGVSVFLPRRTEMDADYFFAAFSSEKYLHANNDQGETVFSIGKDSNRAHGGSLAIIHNFRRSQRLSFDAGISSRYFGFANHDPQKFMGFFNPGFYQSQMLTTRVNGTLWGPVSYDFANDVGIQQTEHSGAVTRALNLSPAITIRLNRRFSLTLGYTHYNTGQALGTLRGNAVRITTVWKQ